MEVRKLQYRDHVFELAPGQDLPSLRSTVQRIRRSDLTYTGTNLTDTRDHFLRTIEELDNLLRYSLEGSNWLDQLQSPAYWVIRDMNLSTGRPYPLIESECQRLDRWLGSFQKELDRVIEEDGANLVSPRLVLDTNAIVRHKSFSHLDWAGLVGAPVIRLVIPILVIRQLDDLKDSGKVERARPRLRMIRNILEGQGRGPAPLPKGQGTLELLMDPHRHVRLQNPDEEIIRRATYLQGRPGGEVQLVTGDYTMQFMAEADGLPVMFLPDELRVGSDESGGSAGQPNHTAVDDRDSTTS
jgi:hypothetical protein